MKAKSKRTVVGPDVGRRVWKYEIEPAASAALELPGDAAVLSVGSQGGKLVLWATVQPDQKPKRSTLVRLFIVMTGAEVPEGAVRFLGTVQGLGDGTIVAHIWES